MNFLPFNTGNGHGNFSEATVHIGRDNITQGAGEAQKKNKKKKKKSDGTSMAWRARSPHSILVGNSVVVVLYTRCCNTQGWAWAGVTPSRGFPFHSYMYELLCRAAHKLLLCGKRWFSLPMIIGLEFMLLFDGRSRRWGGGGTPKRTESRCYANNPRITSM